MTPLLAIRPCLSKRGIPASRSTEHLFAGWLVVMGQSIAALADASLTAAKPSPKMHRGQASDSRAFGNPVAVSAPNPRNVSLPRWFAAATMQLMQAGK